VSVLRHVSQTLLITTTEIKAVTYCGESEGSNLSIKNSPWHEEVRMFAEELAVATNGQYGIACEHKHSCCILLADKSKFYKNEKWYTWIDYPL
jgi:tRNA wybutosine-synthesizing protein 1